MARATQDAIGAVVALWRYPVKSMIGEELKTVQVTDHGLLGDRAYALIDRADGKVATAKNPGKWPTLFGCRGAFLESPRSGVPLPPVRITLPDGTAVTSTQHDCNDALSTALMRHVALAAASQGQVVGVPPSLAPSWTAKSEEYWPDVEGLDHRDTVTEFALPAGTFFDGATVHLLTTATLSRLRGLYPQGRFEVPRFRPNLVVTAMDEKPEFAEQGWIGHTLAIGDEVRLRIAAPCGRCVMTTLAQGNIPKDSRILRTAVHHAQGYVGVYAEVVRGGTIRQRDPVNLLT